MGAKKILEKYQLRNKKMFNHLSLNVSLSQKSSWLEDLALTKGTFWSVDFLFVTTAMMRTMLWLFAGSIKYILKNVSET